VESVRQVHDALGITLDLGWASEVLEQYERRPAWAVPGSVSPSDAMFLGEMIRAVRPRMVLELGVAAGCSTSLLAWCAHRVSRGAPTRVIACDFADTWYHDPSKPVGVAIDHMVDRDSAVRATIDLRTGVTSRTVGDTIGEGTIDFAFIDADHRHPWPVVDLALVTRLVRPGGWIALHDTRLEIMAARHERKSGDPAPWACSGPRIAFEAWPGESVHAATESANIGAVRVPESGVDRDRLIEAIRAHRWETDPSDPELRFAIDSVAPRRATVRVDACVAQGTSPRAMRIALVSREFPPAFGGGIGTAMAQCAAGLIGAGHTVHVVTGATGHSDRVTRRTLRDGLVIHRVPVARPGTEWWVSRVDFAARSARVVEDLHEAGEIDVAEFPECEAPALVHMLAQHRAGRVVPTVIQLHTPTELLFSLRSAAYDEMCDGLWNAVGAERACVGLADGVYAPSRFIADWSADWWGLADHPRVVPYAHAPGIGAGAIADPAPTPMVAYVGRLEPRKGVMVLARAWNAVVDRMPDAMLVLVGSDTSHAVTGGSVRRAMEREMTSAARARAVFAGSAPPGDLGPILDRSRACVIPSVWENFPNVAIEAMARGRPIVASDRGGMAEMIGASIGGVMFRSGDDGGLADALCAILAEPVSRTIERGRAANRAIRAVCDPVATTEKRIEAYRDAIDRAKSRSTPDRARWIEDAARCLDATVGRGSPMGPRPVPVFGTEIMRWVHPQRATLAVA